MVVHLGALGTRHDVWIDLQNSNCLRKTARVRFVLRLVRFPDWVNLMSLMSVNDWMIARLVDWLTALICVMWLISFIDPLPVWFIASLISSLPACLTNFWFMSTKAAATRGPKTSTRPCWQHQRVWSRQGAGVPGSSPSTFPGVAGRWAAKGRQRIPVCISPTEWLTQVPKRSLFCYHFVALVGELDSGTL